MQTRTLDTDPYQPVRLGTDAARCFYRCLAMENELCLPLIAGGRGGTMSFIGLNRYEISLFFLTWRRQLAGKRVTWMMGGLEVQRWPSFPVISVNPNHREVFSTDKVWTFAGIVHLKLPSEKIATNIDPKTRVGMRVRRVKSTVQNLRRCQNNQSPR